MLNAKREAKLHAYVNDYPAEKQRASGFMLQLRGKFAFLNTGSNSEAGLYKLNEKRNALFQAYTKALEAHDDAQCAEIIRQVNEINNKILNIKK